MRSPNVFDARRAAPRAPSDDWRRFALKFLPRGPFFASMGELWAMPSDAMPPSASARPSAKLSPADIDALREALARNPDDAAAHYRLAAALAKSDPASAIDHANEALARMPFHGDAMQPVIVTLAEALRTAGMFAEIVDLAESCKDRWPSFTEMRYREALAYQQLGGHTAEMLEAFESCLEIGDQPSGFSTPGAGSYLPLYYLGRFAETRGDTALAIGFYERALSAGHFAPAADRLIALGGSAPRRGADCMAVVARVTGCEFSGEFLHAWHDFSERCHALGIRVVLKRSADASSTVPDGLEVDHVLGVERDSGLELSELASLLAFDAD